MACGHFSDSSFVPAGKRRGFCRLRWCDTLLESEVSRAELVHQLEDAPATARQKLQGT